MCLMWRKEIGIGCPVDMKAELSGLRLMGNPSGYKAEIDGALFVGKAHQGVGRQRFIASG